MTVLADYRSSKDAIALNLNLFRYWSLPIMVNGLSPALGMVLNNATGRIPKQSRTRDLISGEKGDGWALEGSSAPTTAELQEAVGLVNEASTLLNDDLEAEIASRQRAAILAEIVSDPSARAEVRAAAREELDRVGPR